MRLIFIILLLLNMQITYSQSYLDLSKEDIIVLKGNKFEVSKKGNSITYKTEVKSIDGYPTMPNMEYFKFNETNNVIGYVILLNDAPESYALKLISDNNKKYEKVAPEQSILFKWVDRLHLVIIRIGWIIKDSNGLYSVHYEIDKVTTIK